ncbi:hypothetical protein ACFTQL_23765 [Peribacillus butanolivorans]|uniref:hypothetical protein n=1 Tax=Peribacillus butanolivorans TaxID=421767 RepID=UPI003638F8C6
MERVDYVAKNYPWSRSSAGFWWKMNNMNALIDSGANVKEVTSEGKRPSQLEDRENYYRRTDTIFV